MLFAFRMPVKLAESVVKDLYQRYVQPVSGENNLNVTMQHLQEAHWFYIDHLQALDRNRSEKVGLTFFIHQFVPLLGWQHRDVKARIKEYWKFNAALPRAGGILLNDEKTKIVLVRGHGAKRWGFPTGKLKNDEDPAECALREVFEETGFSGVPSSQAFTCRKKKAIHTLFVFENVPEDYVFAPQTYKEIDEIRWVLFADLPEFLPIRLCKALVDFLGVYTYALP